MPILSKSTSPRWIQKDAFSITEEEAKHQDVRPLRIGLVNYMPDKAFIATEQDFILPVIEAAGVLQFEIILFAPESMVRNQETQDYIDAHYEKITEKRLRDCDILIQTGTNEVNEDGSSFDFITGEIAQEIVRIFRLAQKAGVTTQVGSCFASQVIALNVYNISLRRNTEYDIPKKIIGAFPHSVVKEEDLRLGKAEENFITKNLNSEFNVIFARNHKLTTAEIFRHETLIPLIFSKNRIGDEKTGQHETHLFYDPKELFFGFQGHPEYQKFSVLKEYLRDVGMYYRNSKNIVCPEIPPHYFTEKGVIQMKNFIREVQKVAKQRNKISEEVEFSLQESVLKEFDQINRPKIDDSIYDEVIQSWKDTGDKIWARIFNATYQLTGYEPGEKLTKKRDIAIQKFPLEGLL